MKSYETTPGPKDIHTVVLMCSWAGVLCRFFGRSQEEFCTFYVLESLEYMFHSIDEQFVTDAHNASRIHRIQTLMKG